MAPGITAVGLDPLAVGTPVAGSHHKVMNPQADEPTMQDVPERSRLVAAVHAVGLVQLAVNEADKRFLAEPLRRL